MIPQVPWVGTKSNLTHLPAPPSKGFRSCFSPMLSPAVSPSSHSLPMRERYGMMLHKSQSLQPPVFSFPVLAAAMSSPLGKSRSFPAQRVENHGLQISPATCPYGPESSMGQNLLVDSGKGPRVLTLLESFMSQVPRHKCWCGLLAGE